MTALYCIHLRNRCYVSTFFRRFCFKSKTIKLTRVFLGLILYRLNWMSQKYQLLLRTYWNGYHLIYCIALINLYSTSEWCDRKVNTLIFEPEKYEYLFSLISDKSGKWEYSISKSMYLLDVYVKHSCVIWSCEFHRLEPGVLIRN